MDGKKTWVGCVATSMAQIMCHFSWPERGAGCHSYSWKGKEIALDFSKQEFRWDLMLPDYKGGYTQEQAEAVARLCYACGVAVDMNYGLGGSGAEGEAQADALRDYFGYGKSTTLLDRSDFYTSDWERLMHESLMAGAPVAYMGFADGGGHAFLLDGYDGEGFFHFNWGWTGDADGYFRMSSINPYEESWPGYVYGYNRDQNAVVFALPSFIGDSPFVVMSNRGSLQARWDSGKDEAVLSGKFTYLGSAKSEVRLGVGIVFDDGNEEVLPASVFEMEPMGEIPEISFSLPELTPGAYMVYPAYHDGNGWHRISTSLGNPDAVAMVVNDGGVCFEQKNVDPLTLVSMKQNTPFYMGHPFEVEFELRNDNEFEHAMAYYVAILNGAGGLAWNFNPEVTCLLPGESATVRYQEVLPWFSGLGTYRVALAYKEGGEIRYIGSPSDFMMEIVPQGFSFEGTDVTLSKISESDQQYRLDYGIHCLEGFYCYRLRYAVFDSEGNIVLRKATVDRDFVCDGDTGSFSRNLKFEGLEDGSYTMRLYASVSVFEDDVIDDPYLPFLGEVDFTVDNSGVAPLELHDGRRRIFNLQGIELPDSSEMAPGVYVILNGSRSVKLKVD